MVGLTLSTILI